MRKVLFFLMISGLLFGCTKNVKKETEKQSRQKRNLTLLEKRVKKLMNTKTDEMLVAIIKTNMGRMELKLYPHKTPLAVKNFVALSLKKYYNGVTFHRVINHFMIQGGDPTGTGRGGRSIWGRYFPDEFRPELKFTDAGVLAMANAGPNTNGSQFFITLVPTPWLNFHHTIFGHLIKGMDVLKAIGKVKTDKRDKPVKPVVIKSIKIEKRKIKK